MRINDISVETSYNGKLVILRRLRATKSDAESQAVRWREPHLKFM